MPFPPDILSAHHRFEVRQDKYARNMSAVTGNPKFTNIILSHRLGRLDKSEDFRKATEDLGTKT